MDRVFSPSRCFPHKGSVLACLRMNDGFAVIKQVLQRVPFCKIFQGENAH